MPIPQPEKNEDDKKFVARCMSNETMKKEYQDTKQRVAVCISQTKKKSSGIFNQVLDILGLSLEYSDCDECGSVELLTEANYVEPLESEYCDLEDNPEVVELVFAKYQYRDPLTNELYYFQYKGNYKKNNRYLRYEGEAKASEYQGRKVTLNKPFRTPGGPKKMSVYVKNEKGNVVKVNFGDPNMKIKKNIPERRKSFRARHNCDNPGPKWKARYWSCRAW
jgi:hypothetical protein